MNHCFFLPSWYEEGSSAEKKMQMNIFIDKPTVTNKLPQKRKPIHANPDLYIFWHIKWEQAVPRTVNKLVHDGVTWLESSSVSTKVSQNSINFPAVKIPKAIEQMGAHIFLQHLLLCSVSRKGTGLAWVIDHSGIDPLNKPTRKGHARENHLISSHFCFSRKAGRSYLVLCKLIFLRRKINIHGELKQDKIFFGETVPSCSSFQRKLIVMSELHSELPTLS